jgi:hypothetical protein
MILHQNDVCQFLALQDGGAIDDYSEAKLFKGHRIN